MTRTKKLELLKKYRPHLYNKLKAECPKLVANPDKASDIAIIFYNRLIAEEAQRDRNNEAFRKRFSF